MNEISIHFSKDSKTRDKICEKSLSLSSLILNYGDLIFRVLILKGIVDLVKILFDKIFLHHVELERNIEVDVESNFLQVVLLILRSKCSEKRKKQQRPSRLSIVPTNFAVLRSVTNTRIFFVRNDKIRRRRQLDFVRIFRI